MKMLEKDFFMHETNSQCVFLFSGSLRDSPEKKNKVNSCLFTKLYQSSISAL